MTSDWIQLENLGVFFPPRGFAEDGIWALRDLTVSIKKGDRILIVGDNGSGKTTLLRVLAGLENSTNGDFKLAGKVVQNCVEIRRSIHICFVTQHAREGVVEEFTVADNMIIRRIAFRQENARKRMLYKEAHEFLVGRPGFSPLADAFFEPAGRLSGGWLQMLQVASAVFGNPEILLLDEPTSQLSESNTNSVDQLLQSLPEEVTIICVSHPQRGMIVGAYATQKWRLETGKLSYE